MAKLKTSTRAIRKVMKEVAGERLEDASKLGGKAVQEVAEQIAEARGPGLGAKVAAKATAGAMKAADMGLKGAAIGGQVAASTAGFAGHKAEQLVGTAKAVDRALFKQVGFDKRTFGRQLRPSAFGLFAGGAAVIGAGSGLREVNNAQMGTKDTTVYSPTPSIPSYIDNGEATGDLVFALHDLRRG